MLIFNSVCYHEPNDGRVKSTRQLIFGILILCLAEANANAYDASVLVITKSTALDPKQTYSQIIIKASNITLDGQGALLVGASEGSPKSFKGNLNERDGFLQSLCVAVDPAVESLSRQASILTRTHRARF